MKFVFLVLSFAISAGESSASADFAALKNALHKTSENIEKNADLEKIGNALYEQLRPRAKITNMELSPNEVDLKVREYVEQQYVPVFIDNYSRIYTELREAGKDFTNCKNPEPIDPESDVLKALCVEKDGEAAIVRYMTNGYSQGWSETLVFLLELEADKTTLIEILLQLREGVEAHVPGI
nr:hypothetical protein [uncultured bacterium]